MSLKGIYKSVQQSMNLKIIIITFISLMVFLTAVLAVIYFGMNQLKDKTLTVAEDELNELVEEYYLNYISAVDTQIESRVYTIFDELHILSNVMQTLFSNRSELDSLIDDLDKSLYFEDHLVPYENYYQNLPSEPTSVFVASYMIDEFGKVEESAMSLIKDTQILDLILPSFSQYGTRKIQAYFQGGENREIFRLAPWDDIGKNIVSVYPEIFSQPIWEAFNPGLADEWREWIQNIEDPAELNDMLRVTSPVQDGLTGEIVLTFSQPLANETMDEFEGTISYDVPIDFIIDMVEDIKISDTGFAFISQENGNVFAINEKGLDVFGLSSEIDSTFDEGIGFNRLDRNFEDSIYENVQNISLNYEEEAILDSVTIQGEKYLIVSKSLLSYQTWSADRGFYDEKWEIGFVAPYTEVFSMYNALEKNIIVEMNHLNFNTVMITIAIAVVILFLLYRFTTMVTSELVSLSKAVKMAKDRKYDVEINVKSIDEVGVLAAAFKDMLSEIKHSFDKLEDQNEALKEEINHRKQKDRIIDYLENFDSGTDLPNKKALLNILKDIRTEDNGFVSLVIIGLDEFRKVNEAYSWTFGDMLMNKIAETLRAILPVETLLFKLSGDEFAFIIKDNKFKNLISIIEEVSEAFSAPFYVDKHEITISSSIGISSYPYDSEEPLDIFKFASNAMIHAKEVNRGKYEFYNAEINTTARMRMEMINELRNAIEQDELELIYQPIVSTETLKINGMEALLRWHNKTLGTIPPTVFIPLAEKSKLILKIGDWVLRRALIDTKALHDLGYNHLNVAVNVSIIQFLDDEFIQKLDDIVEMTQIDPKKITIEITEGLFINDLDKILNVLNKIKERGMLISVDDFGTGYSSLSYIKNLPLTKLKIDRSFINEIEDDKSYKLVSGIIGLAQNLNLSLVAEGIETESQLSVIREKKCQEAQGYMFSKPIKLEALIDYIKKENN